MTTRSSPSFARAEFFERGFVTLPDVFSQEEVELMRQAFDRLEKAASGLPGTCMHRGAQFVVDRDEGARGQVRIHRVVWCGAAEPVLSRFGADERLLAVASRLLGTKEMHQLINQAHFKAPGDGVAFPWHQDSTHRRFGQSEWNDVNGLGSYVQTVIALDDVDEHNGPIELIPGSCRHGHIPVDRDGKIPDQFLREREPVQALMRAGSVLAFGPYTLHSSGPNRSERPRRVLINGFAYPGANHRVYPGDGAGRSVHFAPFAG